jgi:SAM-dependent methyltransferase
MSQPATPANDPFTDGYARHWAPVIRPAALRVLDLLAERLARASGPNGPPGAPDRLIDIGTGTGTLAVGALGRWPAATIAAIDGSGEMIERAGRDAAATLDAQARERLHLEVALADRLPFPDRHFAGAVSSFVFQLVPDRAAALLEACRVLRPGGWLVYATWLRESGGLEGPDRIFEEVLDEFGFLPPEVDAGDGDAASPRAAADELRRAGFRQVRATAGAIEHRWTPRSYLAFQEHFAEASLFDDLAERERGALRRRLLAALAAAPRREMRMRLPLVYVEGRRPA